MNEALLNSVVTIALGIIGVATLAVILSRNANTTGVIGATGSAFSSALAAAEAPITGSGLGNTFGQFGSPVSGF